MGFHLTSVDEWMRRFMERRTEEERIRCPYCNRAYQYSDFEDSMPVSYWGEDPHGLWCEDCDRSFVCVEKVRRTYETEEAPDADTD